MYIPPVLVDFGGRLKPLLTYFQLPSPKDFILREEGRGRKGGEMERKKKRDGKERGRRKGGREREGGRKEGKGKSNRRCTGKSSLVETTSRAFQPMIVTPPNKEDRMTITCSVFSESGITQISSVLNPDTISDVAV